MTYNSTSIKSNLNIKIAKYYNDINYYLDFPVKTNPYNNDQTNNNNNNSSDISRYKSIPGFLGLMDNISNTSTYNIFSSSFTGNLLNYITGTQKINIYSLNNSIKLILYTPSSITQIPQNYTPPEYSSSTIDPIIITIPMTSNIEIITSNRKLLNNLNCCFLFRKPIAIN